jgi:hypothetical protein
MVRKAKSQSCPDAGGSFQTRPRVVEIHLGSATFVASRWRKILMPTGKPIND